MREFVMKNFLPLGLVTAVAFAMAYPPPGREVQRHVVEINGTDYKLVSSILIFLIFLSSGFTLKTDDILKAGKNYVAVVYGIVAILLITPTLGFVIMELPLSPKAFSSGLSVFCSVPTTLSSGVALVTLGGGNAALALLLTVGSNLLGILTVPFAVKLVLSDVDGLNFDAVSLLIKLGITILAPLTCGKMLRHSSKRLAQFAKDQKKTFSLANSVCLILIVWQTLSKAQPRVIDQNAGDIFILVACGIGIHLVYLVFNYVCISMLRMEWRDAKALLLCASQKTLPIAVTVVNFLPEPYEGYHGLLIVPCVVSHLMQILIDSVIVSSWIGGGPGAVDSAKGKKRADRSNKGKRLSRNSSGANLVGLVETVSSLKTQKIDPMQNSDRVAVKAPLPQSHPLKESIKGAGENQGSPSSSAGTKPVEIQIELVDILRDEDEEDGE